MKLLTKAYISSQFLLIFCSLESSRNPFQKVNNKDQLLATSLINGTQIAVAIIKIGSQIKTVKIGDKIDNKIIKTISSELVTYETNNGEKGEIYPKKSPST